MIRFAERNLTPLELWHGFVKGLPLYRWPREERGFALHDFLIALAQGNAETTCEADTIQLKVAEDFRHLVVRGGGARELKEVFRETTDIPFTVEFKDEDSPYCGFEGAQEIFTRQNWQSGVAVDWGQSSVKVMTETHRFSVPRNWDQFPLRTMDPNDDEVKEGRRQFRKVLQELVSSVSKLGSVDGVCLALPNRIHNFNIEPSTYLGLEGAAEDILGDLNLPSLLLINDAELAALGAKPKTPHKTLVVTVGYGIGGAVWNGF